ncbi:hypothetical protein BH09VER1_BH09VER1_51300 [soil metagenome]
MTDSLQHVAGAIGVGGVVLAGVGGYVWSLAWLYHDANERGQSGWFLVGLTFLLSWPLVMVGWLIFRPARRENLLVRHGWDGSLSCARCGFGLLGEGERCGNCRVAVVGMS